MITTGCLQLHSSPTVATYRSIFYFTAVLHVVVLQGTGSARMTSATTSTLVFATCATAAAPGHRSGQAVVRARARARARESRRRTRTRLMTRSRVILWAPAVAVMARDWGSELTAAHGRYSRLPIAPNICLQLHAIYSCLSVGNPCCLPRCSPLRPARLHRLRTGGLGVPDVLQRELGQAQ